MHNILKKYDNNFAIFLTHLKDDNEEYLDEQEIIDRFLKGNRSNISEDSIVIAIKYNKFKVAEHMISNKKLNYLILFIRFLENYEREDTELAYWKKEKDENQKIDKQVLKFFKSKLSEKEIKTLINALPEENNLRDFLNE